MTLKKALSALGLGIAFAAAFVSTASAQIRIGQTAGFTGPAASGVKEITDGAKLYFDWVNADGGINGQKIELVSLDDKFDPKLAAENAKKLIGDQRVVSLFLNRGTPHTEAIMPLLVEGKIPLVGPSTGAMSLHSPVHPWVFNVRATYQREAEHLTRHLAMGGADRVAIIQVNDSFGADVAAGAMKVFKEASKKPAAHEMFDRAKPDFSAIAKKIAEAKPLSVLFIGTGTAVVDGIKALRAAGCLATVGTVSPNASAGFAKNLGTNGPGVIVSQVFPSERKMAVSLVSEAVRLAKAKGVSEVTPAMIEGFSAAKVLVIALKRTKELSRSNLRKTLDSFNRVDIGGLELTFSPTDHTGLDYADLSIIGDDGKFRR
jgi:branched-chain amino acid transport system substrate-binding protein